MELAKRLRMRIPGASGTAQGGCQVPIACAGPWTPRGTAVARRQRRRRWAPCAAGSGTPWQYDDLRGGVSDFDDLWREQARAMDRAQAEFAEMQRLMDRRFAAAQAAAREGDRAASGIGDGQAVQVQEDGRCGYSWQRSYERSGGSFHERRSESFTVIGVPPPGCQGAGMHMAPAPSTLHLGPLHGLGLLLAASLAGFWAAATAAFNRRFHLTIYKEGSRWQLLLLWPFLLLVSKEFRQQFWAAARGQPAPRGPAAAGEGPQAGDAFVPGMQAGEQA